MAEKEFFYAKVTKDIPSNIFDTNRGKVSHGWGYVPKGNWWSKGTRLCVSKWTTDEYAYALFGNDRKVMFMSEDLAKEYLQAERVDGKRVLCPKEGDDLYQRWRWEMDR